MSQPTHSKHLRHDLLAILIIFCVSFSIFSYWSAHLADISISDFIIQFKNSLYHPHHNTILIKKIGDAHPMDLLYKSIFFSTFVTTTYFIIFSYRRDGRDQHLSFSQMVPIITMTALLLFASVQQIHRTEDFFNKSRMYSGKSMHEKKLRHLGAIYQFSKLAQDELIGRHQAGLVSDFDFSKDSYMFDQRLLSYHFYPKVSLRFDNDTPQDCLILYFKNNPLAHIPKNYKILVASQDHNHILAIKDHYQK